MAIPEELNTSYELDGGSADEVQQRERERDISQQAVWSVSSCKQGCGVQKLRDGNTTTYWQSDGPQPHYINMEFQRKTLVEKVLVYLDFAADESYTPSKISVLAGSYYHDLQQICTKDFDQPSGWAVIHIKDIHSKPVSAFLLQVAFLSNHQNGRDCRVRQIKIVSPVVNAVAGSDHLSHHGGVAPLALMKQQFFTTPEFQMCSTIR